MNNTLKILLCGLFLLTAGLLQAQIGPPPPPGGAPVDGGAGLLVAAGIAYGAKKLRDSRRNRKNNTGGTDSPQS